MFNDNYKNYMSVVETVLRLRSRPQLRAAFTFAGRGMTQAFTLKYFVLIKIVHLNILADSLWTYTFNSLIYL